MRIMILGAAGFIGTNLTEKISSANGDVITLVDKDWSALKRLSTLQRDLVNRKQIKLVMEQVLMNCLRARISFII